MRAAVLRLEDFGGGAPSRADREAQEQAAARARGEGHAAGYAEGYAAAMAAGEAEDRAAVVALREAVQDLELTQAAARADALARLRPVIEALARVAAPEAAARGFAGTLAEAVERRLAGDGAPRLAARVAPERVEGVALRLGDRVEVRPDPALTGAQARLEWTGGGAEIDVDGCLAAAREAVAIFFDEAEREARHVG